LIFAHGIRLSAYLLLREVGKGEDRRYSKLREKFGSHFWWLSYFFLFLPAMAVNMLVGSQIYAFANVDKTKIGHLTYWAGLLTMIAGGALGAAADIQRFTFRMNKRNEGKILDKGLWSISRHPNYLGEIIYWWGVYIVNFSAGILWTFICPIVLSFMILFVTGIPVNERIMSEEHGDEYLDYVSRVPIFIPFFGFGKGNARPKEIKEGEKLGGSQNVDSNTGSTRQSGHGIDNRQRAR